MNRWAIIISYVVVAGLSIAVTIGITGCKTMTPLQQCISMSKLDGVFNDSGRDSAFLKLCERYHREELVKNYVNVLVPKRIYNPKTQKLENVIDKDGKIIYISGINMSRKSVLLYIDNGTLTE